MAENVKNPIASFTVEHILKYFKNPPIVINSRIGGGTFTRITSPLRGRTAFLNAVNDAKKLLDASTN